MLTCTVHPYTQDLAVLEQKHIKDVDDTEAIRLKLDFVSKACRRPGGLSTDLYIWVAGLCQKAYLVLEEQFPRNRLAKPAMVQAARYVGKMHSCDMNCRLFMPHGYSN
jgi:hypothetical protein